jgi:hypothetical protein
MKRCLLDAGKKLLEEAISVKVHILATATVLLCYHLISDTVWSTVVCAIGLGRVLIETIVASKGPNGDSRHTEEP